MEGTTREQAPFHVHFLSENGVQTRGDTRHSASDPAVRLLTERFALALSRSAGAWYCSEAPASLLWVSVG